MSSDKPQVRTSKPFLSSKLSSFSDGPLGAFAAATRPAPTGKPGDFDFLGGPWEDKNRQLKKGVWDQFDSEAAVFGILGGIASVEELRIPARSFSAVVPEAGARSGGAAPAHAPLTRHP